MRERVLERTAIAMGLRGHAEIGYDEYQRSGSPLPDSTIQEIRHAAAALFGAVTTPPNIQNYFSPVVRMRQALELYANLRPMQIHSTSLFKLGH